LRKVLVIQTAFPGDLILLTPLLEAVKAGREPVHLSLLTLPGNAGLFDNSPFVDEILTYDKKGTERGFIPFLKLVQGIRKRKFAAAIVPHPSLRSALLALLGGIRIRFGFAHRVCAFLYTERVETKGTAHEVERNLALAAAFGAPVSGFVPKLFPSETDRLEAGRVLEAAGIDADGPFVAVAPGSSWATKAWPEGKYMRLLNGVRVECPVVLVGGVEDSELCDRLARPFDEGEGFPVVSAAGRTNLLQSAVLISQARVLISGDSAPVHLASAVGTPVVIIYGPTVSEFGFLPYRVPFRVIERDLTCRPCSAHGSRQCPLEHFRCMRDISEDEVLGAALELFRTTSGTSRGRINEVS